MVAIWSNYTLIKKYPPLLYTFAMVSVLEVFARRCTLEEIHAPRKPDVWQPDCQEHYRRQNNPIYCMRYSTTPLTWQSARQACQKEGADLFLGHTSRTMTQLNEYINSLTGFWLGLTMNYEGDWAWLDERYSGKELTYTKWLHNNEDVRKLCAVAQYRERSSTDLVWNQTSCESHQYFICEKNTVKDCPKDWEKIHVIRVCVRFFLEPKQYKDARAFCQAAQSDMVTIRDQQHDKHIARFYYSYVTRVWIGLHALEGREVYTWIDGYTIYEDWHFQHQIHILNSDQPCILFTKLSVYVSNYCDRPFDYVCQKQSPNGPTLPQMQVHYNGEGNTLVINKTAKVTCIARRVSERQLTWSVLMEDRLTRLLEVIEDNAVENTVGHVMLEGQCVLEVVSTLTFTPTADFEKAYVNCYAYKQSSPPPWCPNNGNPLTFCASSQLHLTDREKGPASPFSWSQYRWLILLAIVLLLVLLPLTFTLLWCKEKPDSGEDRTDSGKI